MIRSRCAVAFILVALAGLLASGCGGDEASAGSGDPDTLRVALLPDENANEVIKNNEALQGYLETKLDKKIELVVTTDYSSMIEAMRRGRLELAYFGPLSYVLAQQRADIEPFAALDSAEEAGEEPTYKSVVIANADSGITQLAQARGKNVAFGDPASTSSHLIPKGMLADAGLKAGDGYKENFTGAHDAVALAVQNGNAELGGLSKPILTSLLKEGTIDRDKVRVVKESEPAVNYPWTMQSNLDPALKKRIRDAFLQLKDPAVLEPFEAAAFRPVKSSDYDPLRALAKRLGVDIGELAG